MKNNFKIALAILGMVSATFATSIESNASEPISQTIMCNGEMQLCTVLTSGIRLYEER